MNGNREINTRESALSQSMLLSLGKLITYAYPPYPNKITIGKDVYEVLHPEIKSEFVEVEQNIENWKYTDRMTGRIYNL